MTRRLLILRPQPGAQATAARATQAGFATVVAPLFVIRPCDWTPPDADAFDAVVLTSANALHHAGPALARFTGLPAYAVGAATAAAARAAGFTVVHAGDGDAVALAERCAAAGVTRVLHLAGQDHRPLARPGLRADTRIVYAAVPVRELPTAAADALRDGAVALIHSPRAAALFRGLIDRAGIDPAKVRLAAISAAALATAGEGWAATTAAAEPSDDALLAAAARLCDQGGGRDG